MHKAPLKQIGPDGLPLPPHKVYNIGNSSPENLLDFVQILQEELVAAGVLPADYDFEAHKELMPMQPGPIPIPGPPKPPPIPPGPPNPPGCAVIPSENISANAQIANFFMIIIF